MIIHDVVVNDPAHVGYAQRIAGRAARVAGFDEIVAQRVALAATELASNLLRYACGGALYTRGHADRLELTAVDRGPGIQRVADSMRDGFSTTAGSLGSGLGAVRRAADEFDIYSLPNAGTVVLARWGRSTSTVTSVGGLAVPAPGEVVCGDTWTVAARSGRLTVVACDGLGHGPAAAAASDRAVEVVQEHGESPPGRLLGLLHRELASTRGGAVAIAQVEPLAGRLRFAGVGNVTTRLYRESTARHQNLVSRGGIVGMHTSMFRVVESTCPWSSGDWLVMHTDGLTERWSMANWPDLADHDATTIAAWIVAQASRRRDDACAVVVISG